MTKQAFINQAEAYGVKAVYSGATKTMFVVGEDSKVKSFIRVINLKGKNAKAFNLAQGQKVN